MTEEALIEAARTVQDIHTEREEDQRRRDRVQRSIMIAAWARVWFLAVIAGVLFAFGYAVAPHLQSWTNSLASIAGSLTAIESNGVPAVEH